MNVLGGIWLVITTGRAWVWFVLQKQLPGVRSSCGQQRLQCGSESHPKSHPCRIHSLPGATPAGWRQLDLVVGMVTHTPRTGPATMPTFSLFHAYARKNKFLDSACMILEIFCFLLKFLLKKCYKDRFPVQLSFWRIYSTTHTHTSDTSHHHANCTASTHKSSCAGL